MTDKEKVLAVYPTAVAQRHGVILYIQNGCDGDALGFSFYDFEEAWASALKNIEKQKQ